MVVIPKTQLDARSAMACLGVLLHSSTSPKGTSVVWWPCKSSHGVWCPHVGSNLLLMPHREQAHPLVVSEGARTGCITTVSRWHVRSRRDPPSGSSAQTRPVASVFMAVPRRVWPAAVKSSPAVLHSPAASRSLVRSRSVCTHETSDGSTGGRSRVRRSVRDLRANRSFLWEISVALTGQRTAHGPHRARPSSAHSPGSGRRHERQKRRAATQPCQRPEF